eukprot:CAMPEP_0196723592 /NCGR_PEP_ID=MMETSP1091-20130531/5687_1 /TAXON_ID=302021 /ORGANISM="Rhodomonas sp., Strain CCMP768" /LENGTH=285 /DNA_ID=CAMNT_0042065549 /DNA_START=185 /DNA_END=1042 /DNA_ORIENTATION=+
MALSAKKKSKAGPTAKALKKRTGAVTVSFEVLKAESSEITDVELELLSMRLRKMGVASLWTSDLDTLLTVCKEQKSAKGDFPGPCAIVFNGDLSEALAAVAAGASAVVVAASEVEVGETVAQAGAEVIWNIDSAEQVDVLAGSGASGPFLVDAKEQDVRSALSKDAVVVSALDSMQPDQAEMELCRELVASGCKSIMLRNAIVGDEEDLQYSRFVLDKLKDKSSSNFRITGMTGSTNGHFGTGSFGAQEEAGIVWKRLGGEGLGPDVAATAAVVGKSNMRAWAAK